MSRALLKNLATGLSCLLFAAPAASASAKGVVLASPDLPAPGTVITWTEVDEMKDMALMLRTGGAEIPGSMSQKHTVITTTSILSATKVRLVADENKVEGAVTIRTVETPLPPADFALKGLPVILEGKDGRDGNWTSTLESGNPLSKAEFKELLSQTSVRSVKEGLGIYGSGEHEAGEKWEVDLTQLPSFAGLSQLEGKLSAEFEKIETIAETECATIKLTFDVSGTTPEGSKVHLQGESTHHRSIADRIDLDSKLSAKVDITAFPQPDLTTTMSGTVEAQRTNTVKKQP